MSAFDQSDRAPVAFSRTSLWRRLVLRQLGEGVASRGALEPATGKGRIGCARSSSFCSCSQLAPPQANRPEPPLTGRRRLNGPSVPSAPLSARHPRVAAAQSSVPRARPRSVSPAVAPWTSAGCTYARKTRAVRASEWVTGLSKTTRLLRKCLDGLLGDGELVEQPGLRGARMMCLPPEVS